MRNKILFSIFISFYFSVRFAHSQCVQSSYLLPDTVCPNKSIAINNASTATYFNWDNGLGDLDSIPLTSAITGISGLNYPNSIKTLKYQGNYYAFLTNSGSNYLTRLDFGSSINNTPSVVNLPSNANLSNGAQSVNIVQENNKWLLFVLLSNPNSLLKIELDSITQTNNLNYTSLSISGMNNSNSLKLINHFGVMANMGDDKLVVIDFNGDYNNIPTTSNLISTGIPSNNSLDLSYEWTTCSYYAFLGSYSWGTVTRVDFGNSLNNSASKTIVLTGLYTSTSIKTEKENGKWHLFLTYNNGIANYNLGSSITGLPNQLYFSSANGLLASPSNVELIKELNEWIMLTANYYQWNVIKLNFPFANITNNQSSNSSIPNNLFFSPDLLGYQPIELREEFENGITNSYFDSVYVNIAPPIANFSTSSSCINDSVNFYDLSDICFGNVTSWNWDFGDGNTSTDQNPSHVYLTSGTFNVIMTIYDNLNQSASYSKTLYVHEKPQTYFTFNNNACAGSVVLFTDSSVSNDGIINNWDWTINNSSSASNNTTSIFSESGIYQIQLAISTEFGCTDSLQQLITILPAPIANFTVSNTCIGETTFFINQTDSNTISNVSYHWDFGGITSSNNPSPAFQFPLSSGIYPITMSASSPNGCADTIYKSLLIGNKPNPDFYLSTDTVCQNTTFTITDNSTPGISNTIITRKWDMGNGVIINDSTQFNFSYSLPGLYQIQLAVKSPSDCDSIISKSIYVIASPIANYSVSAVCFGNNTTFIDSSTSPTGSFITNWEYNFGDNSSSTIANTFHEYVATGSYSTSLIVTSDKGCRDTACCLPAVVYSLPIANFYYDKACTDKLIGFKDSSIVTNTIQSWAWTFGNNLGTSNLQNPNFSFNNNFAYPVQLICTETTGCSDTITKYVVAEKTPKFSLITNNNCLGTANQFNFNNLNTASTNLAYLWNFGDSTSAFQPNPSHLFNQVGQFEISLEITDLTNGCANTQTDTLTIFPNPEANFISQDGCIGKDILLNDSSLISTGTLQNYQWSCSNGTTSNSTDLTFNSATNGLFSITHTITSNEGCKDSITKTIHIHSNPTVVFSTDFNYGAPPLTIQFDNMSSAGNYLWNFGDGSLASTLDNPSHMYFDTGSYHITLIVTNAYGCIDSNYSVVNVFDPIVDMEIISNSIFLSNNKWIQKALLRNNGNVTIENALIKLSLDQRSVVYEKIDAIAILPGDLLEYEFKTSFDAGNYLPSYFCTEATEVNNAVDKHPEDNLFCTTITDQFNCYNLFPNPVENDVNFGVNLPEEGRIDIELYSEHGSQCLEHTSRTISKGYTTINLGLNTSKEFASGNYIINIRYKEEKRALKFIKK
ncbi:MAG: PKD domain-containing protein [Bacteroidota bacterium]